MPDLRACQKLDCWSDVVEGSDIVVHLAALVPSGPMRAGSDWQTMNTTSVERLAQACISARVKRLIFVSTAGVYGAGKEGLRLSEDDCLNPVTLYARSKLEAEKRLQKVLNGTDTEWVIVRPPIVYGFGPARSLSLLARCVMMGVPLPLSALSTNRRDMIGVTNLASALELCLTHPRASRQVFNFCDGHPLSTSGLVEEIARLANCDAKLFRVPRGVFGVLGRLPPFRSAVHRLLYDFCLDDSKARNLLDWQPECALEHDLGRLVEFLRDEPRRSNRTVSLAL